MIRRLRWKITGVTMLVALMVLLAVFAGVYLFSRANIARSYTMQLRQVVQSGVEAAQFPCFVAEVLPSGTVRVSGSSYYDLSDEQTLLALVAQALGDGGESGVLAGRHLRFFRQDGLLTTRVAFMDCSFEQATLRALVRSCLLLLPCAHHRSGYEPAQQPAHRQQHRQRRYRDARGSRAAKLAQPPAHEQEQQHHQVLCHPLEAALKVKAEYAEA